jgi:hypothetical protein
MENFPQQKLQNENSKPSTLDAMSNLSTPSVISEAQWHQLVTHAKRHARGYIPTRVEQDSKLLNVIILTRRLIHFLGPKKRVQPTPFVRIRILSGAILSLVEAD